MWQKLSKNFFWNFILLMTISAFVFLFGWLLKNDKKENFSSVDTDKYTGIPLAHADTPQGGGISGGDNGGGGSSCGGGGGDGGGSGVSGELR